MTEKFKILANYIKDLSSETADIETYLFVKENISKYHLDIDITSKALKNKLIEVNTTLKFEDKDEHSPFFRVHPVGGVREYYINRGHNFYKKIWNIPPLYQLSS